MIQQSHKSARFHLAAVGLALVSALHAQTAIYPLYRCNCESVGARRIKVSASSFSTTAPGRLNAYVGVMPTVTVDLDSVGASGLDTGVVQPSRRYYIFAQSNTTGGDVTAVASLSEASPGLVGGRTNIRYIGPVFTDSAANVLPYSQNDKTFFYDNPVLVYSSSSPPSTFTTLPLAPYLSNRSRIVYLLKSHGRSVGVPPHFVQVRRATTNGGYPAFPASDIGGYEVVRVHTDSQQQIEFRVVLANNQRTELYVYAFEL